MQNCLEKSNTNEVYQKYLTGEFRARGKYYILQARFLDTYDTPEEAKNKEGFFGFQFANGRAMLYECSGSIEREHNIRRVIEEEDWEEYKLLKCLGGTHNIPSDKPWSELFCEDDFMADPNGFVLVNPLSSRVIGIVCDA